MLLLNYQTSKNAVNSKIVSIHLMLLLNKRFIRIILFLKPSFNTSYVVIKQTEHQCTISFRAVSIHLMLLLNFLLQILLVELLMCFNTSYVVIKPHAGFTTTVLSSISIHLMLLLNRKRKRTARQ